MEQLGVLPYPRIGRSDQLKYCWVLSLSSIVRANQRRLTRSPFDPDTICQQLPCHRARRETSSSVNPRTHIDIKIMLSNVKAAIRVVPSDNTVHEDTSEVLQSLKLRHPPALAPIIPADNITVSADQGKIMCYLRSFSGGCCGGIDGLRIAHGSQSISNREGCLFNAMSSPGAIALKIEVIFNDLIVY